MIIDYDDIDTPEGVFNKIKGYVKGKTDSSKTLKSSVVTVADAAPINAEDITVDITPVQLGSGTPSPDNIRPIEGRTGAELDRVGKNKLQNQMTAGTVGGITVTPNTDGSIACSGTVTNAGYTRSINSDFTLPIGTYTLSGCSATLGARIYLFDAGGTELRRHTVYDGEVNFEVTSDVAKISLNAITGTVGTSAPSAIYPMIRLASVTDSTYEPYQGQQYTASFGETVYGGKWHVTAGGADKTHGNIASYNGETINEPWLSSLDEYSPGATPTTGAQVVYPLTTPTTISTPKQNVPMLQGINTVYADCGDTQLKYQPDNVIGELKGEIEDSIIYEDFKWTTNSSQSYSAGTPGTYGTSSWRDVKKEGYDVIGVTFVENRRFGDCILTLYYVPSTSHVEVIIFRATSSAVTIADEDVVYRVAYKKRT